MMELTLEQQQELQRRSRAYEANPKDVMTHEEVLASIRRRGVNQSNVSTNQAPKPAILGAMNDDGSAPPELGTGGQFG
jgi:hypothetical protein